MPKKNSVRTSNKIAKSASKALKNKSTSKTMKQLAGSALSNRKKNSKR